MRLPLPCEDDGSIALYECALCGDEMYMGQSAYFINGEAICEDCLGAYARSYFSGFIREIGRECDE